HVAVGVGLTYTTLAGFFNQSILEVTRGEISVQHGPLPWFGNRVLSTMDIDQLYCEENASNSQNGSSRNYNLSALLKNGSKLELLKNLDSPEIGLYIEQQIETWLGIKDKPVAGEIPR